MHLQTLAITINQSLIGHDRYYEVGFRAGTPQQDRVCEAMNAPVGISSGRTVCVSRWRGFAPTSSEKRLLRAINKQRQGITMEVVPCLLLCTPLYCAFRVNRGVRPYMAGTHVRRKKGRFLHIGVFFRLSVWYTRFSLTNRNLQDGETYGRIDTKMFMGNYRLI